ncbi:MAG TPA: STAS domain-containing protein [Tepidisphaeraceae bacterium]|jgi:anti-anti-sigma factor|nr:STAS domain-containing protein [Tepidisphaeraceae bacterium]
MTHLLEENIDGVTVLRISGSLTVAGLPEIEARFNTLLEKKNICVVADLAQVDAITTPAITLMLRTARTIEKNGGKMVFASARPNLRKIFACCRLDRVLTFESDFPTALKIAQTPEPAEQFG